jgi:hypothetical protein
MQPQPFQPRFKPGDRVIVRGGRQYRWRVIGVAETVPWEIEPAFLLEDGQGHRRTALQSKLQRAPDAEPSS